MQNEAVILIASGLFWLAGCGATESPRSHEIPVKNPVAALRQLMLEQTRFVKLHAAEALLALGQPEGVHDAFLAEVAAHDNQLQYRVVVWRVLARVAPTAEQREQWLRRIVDAFLDERGLDRLHAIESLAKLDYQIPPEEAAEFERATNNEDTGVVLFAHWVLAQNGNTESHAQAIGRYLRSSDPIARLRAGYILRHFDVLPASIRAELFVAAEAEPIDSIARAYLVASAFVTAERSGQEDHVAFWRNFCKASANHHAAPQRAAASAGFAESGTRHDLPLIRQLMRDTDPDVRVFAAYALAQIESRDRRMNHF